MAPGRQLEFERALWRSGIARVGGIDEAGRGALAGPVVAAIVCCDGRRQVEKAAASKAAPLVRDSKTLTALQRSVAREFICKVFGSCGVGIVSSDEIDQFGISAANRIAMERALVALTCSPDFLLIDAFTIDSEIPQWGIIDGDARSFLISAASILAKVTRDELMITMSSQYSSYRFDRHKGYATEAHLQELQEHGACPIHRYTFAPVRELRFSSLG